MGLHSRTNLLPLCLRRPAPSLCICQNVSALIFPMPPLEAIRKDWRRHLIHILVSIVFCRHLCAKARSPLASSSTYVCREACRLALAAKILAPSNTNDLRAQIIGNLDPLYSFFFFSIWRYAKLFKKIVVWRCTASIRFNPCTIIDCSANRSRGKRAGSQYDNGGRSRMRCDLELEQSIEATDILCGRPKKSVCVRSCCGFCRGMEMEFWPCALFLEPHLQHSTP